MTHDDERSRVPAPRDRAALSKRPGGNVVGTLFNNATEGLIAESDTKKNLKVAAAIDSENKVMEGLIKREGLRTTLTNTSMSNRIQTLQQETSLVQAEATLAAAKEAAGKAAAPPPPPQQSEVDKINVENERLKVEIERHRLQAILKEASKPKPEPKASPPPEDPVEKAIRELKIGQMRRSKILKEAEDLARQFPEDAERIMNDARKIIEGLRGAS